MLGTFDLDDVDFRSPDEILATLAPEPTVSEPDDRPQASPADERALTRDIPPVGDVQSDEILRQLEEHHQRAQTTARPSAPRGSAELRPALGRKVTATRTRKSGGRASGESKPRSQRKRAVLSLAAAAVFTVSVSAVTLVQLGRTAHRAPTPIRSSRLAATTAFTFAPTKLFDTVANTIAAEERELTSPVYAPAKHYAGKAIGRKRPTRHHVVTHATVASSSATSSIPSYSNSSSAPASSSQPATGTAAAATSSSTSNQSRPAFGQDGSLGPGRGAPGTQ